MLLILLADIPKQINTHSTGLDRVLKMTVHQGTSEGDLVWEYSLCSCNHLRRGHSGLRWALTPMAGVLIKRGRFGDTERQKEEGHEMMETVITNAKE